MQTFYVLAPGTVAQNPLVANVTRAAALTASLIVGDPSGLVTSYPSVVVLSSAHATVVIPDNTGQATLAAVQAAQTSATAAEATAATTTATIYADVQARMVTLAAWIAANPSGAILTAAQTLVLAEMLHGVGEVLLGMLSSATGD
jgi:hypothetical protein